MAVCPLPRDDTLNTSFAEYLAFSLIYLFFYRFPINSVVPRSPAVRSLAARAPAIYGAGAYAAESLERAYPSGSWGACNFIIS